MPLKRLLVVYHELPYPINHGGRLDVWRRLQALANSGFKIHLVCWRNKQLGDTVPELGSPFWDVVESATFFEEKGQFHKPYLAFSLPAYARSRLLNSAEWADLVAKVRQFDPQVMMLEGPFSYPTLRKLVDQFGLKYVYRSHNVEHQYARSIYKKAIGLKAKLRAGLNVLGIKQLELDILKKAHCFFDCSQDDVSHWQSLGFSHGQWLPPVVQAEWANQVGNETTWSPSYDVGYLGNLYQPNNVHGVLWFLKQVVPELRALVPDIKGFVAGARPSHEIMAAAEQAGWLVIPDPKEAVPVLRNAKVLINPVFAGSGVNTKCIEMLFTPAALVATPVALNGLAEAAKVCFAVADQANAFAQAIVEGMNASKKFDMTARDRARACHDHRKISSLLAALDEASSKQKVMA